MNIIEQTKEIVLDVNGVVELMPTPVPEGVPAFNSVKITTNVPSTIGAVLEVSQNGTYSPQEGSMYNSVVVNIPSEINNQDKTVTANGVVTADLGFSGLGTVTVEVEPTEEQIAEFKAEGAEEQKAKLIETSISSNGTYEREDGYSKVTVAVQPTEEQKEAYRSEGKASQLTADKSAVAAASPIISNGTKTILDTQVVVNVPSDPAELAAKYTEGETAGKAEQLSADKLDVLRVNPITSNGVKEILGESITVNVPPDQEYLDAAKAEGKEEQLTADKAEVVSVSPIKSNGTKTILGEEVVVDVPTGGGAVQESKTVEITTSGEHTITPDEGYDGIASTTVDVKAVGGSESYAEEIPISASWDGYYWDYRLNTGSLVNPGSKVRLPVNQGDTEIQFLSSSPGQTDAYLITTDDEHPLFELDSSGNIHKGGIIDNSAVVQIIPDETSSSSFRLAGFEDEAVLAIAGNEELKGNEVYINPDYASEFSDVCAFVNQDDYDNPLEKLDARSWDGSQFLYIGKPNEEGSYNEVAIIKNYGAIPVDFNDFMYIEDRYNYVIEPSEDEFMLNEYIGTESPYTLIAASQKVDLRNYKSMITSDVAYEIQSQIETSHPGDTITYSWEDPYAGTKTIEITLPTE